MHPIIFLFFLLVVVVIVASWIASQGRRKALAAWAGAHGLNFDPDKFRGLDEKFPDFDCLSRGGGRYAYNAMAGHWNGRATVAFDYHYSTGSGKDSHDYHFSAVILESRVPLKPLFIRPEGFLDKVGAFFGHEDINFESAEFSRKFYVQGPDRKWAYDVIHPRTIEFLLAAPVFTIRLSPTHVIAYRPSRFTPEEFGYAADVAGGILDRLPEYLVREQAGAT
jgi:hypothetical protein